MSFDIYVWVVGIIIPSIMLIGLIWAGQTSERAYQRLCEGITQEIVNHQKARKL